MYRFLSSHLVRVAVCMAALIVGGSTLRIPWTATAYAQEVFLPPIQSSSSATGSSDTGLQATASVDADADGMADDLLGAPPSESGAVPFGPTGGDSATSYVDIGIVDAGYPSYPFNRLTTLGYTVEMIPPDATIETMNAYDIIYLPASWARAEDPSFDVIEANASRFQTYAAEGGGLLIEQPNPFDRVGGIVTPALLPFPITFYAFYDARDNPPIVVDSGHYLTQDLAPEDLPFPADLMQDVDPHYKVLVVGNTTGSPSLAVTDYGAGRILIHTAHANPSSTFPFSDWTYIRMIEWLANKERPLSPISGRVADQDDVGVGSVKIHAYGPEYTINATTNWAGEFEMRGVPPGQYTIVAEAAAGDGVWPEAIQVVVPPYAEHVDFIYTQGAPPQPPAVSTSVSGIVRAEGTNARIAGATVTIGGLRVKTNSSGAYSFAAVSPGIHQIRIRRDGYLYYRDFVTVGARGVPVTHNATLAYIVPDGYRLPYPGGEAHAVLQGYDSGSHDGNANYALDFDFYSDPVVAAADGVVKAVRDDSSENCWPGDACRNDANYVLMRHKDQNGRLFDTLYWHLEADSVTVAEGDSLQRGEPIANIGQHRLVIRTATTLPRRPARRQPVGRDRAGIRR